VLLHIVIACELLLAAFECAWYCFLRCVNFGVSGSVARSGKRLVTSQRVPVATVESLSAPLSNISISVVVMVLVVDMCLGARAAIFVRRSS
jgi:hypothetical protein